MRIDLAAGTLIAVLACANTVADELRNFFGPATAPTFKLAAQQPCTHSSTERIPFFGATHIHTALSADAAAFGVNATPDDAYGFARGGTIQLTSRDNSPNNARTQQLAAPLDFAIVTDHAEYLGEAVRCSTPGNEGYDSQTCKMFRGEELGNWPEKWAHLARLFSLVLKGNAAGRDESVCGSGGLGCLEAMANPWTEIQKAAERWDDSSSDCSFTTFVGYEYSLAANANNLHRNIIFRNAVVPPLPVSARDAQTPQALWQNLEQNCVNSGTGCDVLAIPHNSNWSAGTMFYPDYLNAETESEQAELAQLRQKMEPLVEIMQVKGDSECRNGLFEVFGGADELCDFEKLRPPKESTVDCELQTGVGGMQLSSCISRLSYARYGLIEGLKERNRIGVNPFKFGIIAATDNHNGTGGAVAENDYQGANGMDITPADRLQGEVEIAQVAKSSLVRYNPGGIAGVWAEENSRDSIFAAMKRRETFGTSGPRITPRFFGGWDYPADMCERHDFAASGYRTGVPMGGDLPPVPLANASAPQFAVNAFRDPSSDGAPLQRIQIIKGWYDDSGRMHQNIYDVAGTANNGASVDVDSCTRHGEGHASLCTVWQDPDFDPERDAVYYARVIENPSCRWSTYQCNQLPPEDRPASCTDPEIPKTIQERAWTSPIWYTPDR